MIKKIVLAVLEPFSISFRKQFTVKKSFFFHLITVIAVIQSAKNMASFLIYQKVIAHNGQ